MEKKYTIEVNENQLSMLEYEDHFNHVVKLFQDSVCAFLHRLPVMGKLTPFGDEPLIKIEQK